MCIPSVLPLVMPVLGLLDVNFYLFSSWSKKAQLFIKILHFIGAIIGPGGNRIRSIRAESHCNISIGDSDSASNERIITIDGTHKQIQVKRILILTGLVWSGQGASRR